VNAGDVIPSTVACFVRRAVNEETRREVVAFRDERDWAQLHTPANLAKSISIEAAELLECFQWPDEGDHARASEELADVLTYCILMADRLGVDLDQIVLAQLAQSREKYPAAKARGRSTKYGAL